MKKNILDPDARAGMVARIAQIQPDSPRQWGKMTAGECLCHLADQLRMALGSLPVAGKPGFFGRTVMKRLVLWGMPAPKGKVPTAPELNQETSGTKPTSFEADRKALLDLIDAFLAKPAHYKFQTHPFFGDFTKEQWGKLVWTHLDHHLRQFGN